VANPPSWNEADRDRVKRMLIDGWSRDRISKAMGMSRSAAVGRIFRDPKLREIAPGLPRQATQPRKWRMPVPLSKVKPPRRDPAIREKVASLPPPAVRNVPLSELLANECRWPVTADDVRPGEHLFCGAKTRPLQHWCPYHRLIGYTAAGLRRYG
jgi:GcrA cell cycle regulator